MHVRQIILTTDRSDHARSDYGCAVDLASKCDASLHLVHFAGALPSLLPANSQETLFDTLETALTYKAKEHPALGGIEVQPHLQRHRWTRTRQREPQRKLSIDLIVMSPPGRTSLSKTLLGSLPTDSSGIHRSPFCCSVLLKVRRF